MFDLGPVTSVLGLGTFRFASMYVANDLVNEHIPKLVWGDGVFDVIPLFSADRSMSKASLENGMRILQVICEKHGICVLPYNARRSETYVNSIACGLFEQDNETDVTIESFLGVRDELFASGWDLTRQKFKVSERVFTEFYLYDVEIDRVSVGYHATRTVNLNSIFQEGILPGTVDRINSDRLDTAGNIYVAKALGSKGDKLNGNLGTAHWWLETFAVENNHCDRNWSILKIDFSENPELFLYQDPFSKTGRIIRTKSPLTKGIQVVS